MLVRQKYAGWVGIKMNGVCANKDMVFSVTNADMDNQLEETVATPSEVQGLINGISKMQFKAKEQMIAMLNRIGREMVKV